MLKIITNCTQCVLVQSMKCNHAKTKNMYIGINLTDHSLPNNCPLLKEKFVLKAENPCKKCKEDCDDCEKFE